MTLFWLSGRDIRGDEVDRYGPFDEIILRPGSNWIEVRSPGNSVHDGWNTISLAVHHRVYVEVTNSAEDETGERKHVDWSAPW